MPEFQRLLSMTPGEIAFRLRDRGRSLVERAGLHTPARVPQGAAFKRYLAGAPKGRFYRGVDDAAAVWDAFPEWSGRALREADDLCRHDAIDWHRDPVTGKRWEQSFWTHYQPEHDPEGRDPKIIHEWNRHQHLPRLAKAFAFTGEERYAGEAVRQLLSWIGQNPPGIGINWQSSLEIAIRSVSWVWTLFLLLPSQALDDAAAHRIGDSLFAQLDHVHRHTSRYSSPNTHLIGEAAALFIAGLVFRDSQCGAEWLETGKAILSREAGRQFLPDGVYGELSSYYHCYALDFYLQALILAEQNNIALPGIRETLESALQFLMHISRPDGSLPLLGDDDGGRALALASRDYRSFRDALCSGAVLYRRRDFKYCCGDFAEECWWMLGAGAADTYRRLDAAPPVDTRLFCSSGGYCMDRSGWDASDSHMIFDCGGLGMLTGGHSHADALAVSLFAGGRELLVDPGTFVYNGAPEWRRHFRSTRAHNTVTVDGRDQAECSGTFRWRRRFSTQAVETRRQSVAYIEAEHSAYPGIIHRRGIVQVQPGYWFLLDHLIGSGEHAFESNFHFGPQVQIASCIGTGPDVVSWSDNARMLLALSASANIEASLVPGWASEGYGHKQPITGLRVQFTAQAPVSTMTLVAACADRPIVTPIRVDDGSAIAFSCTEGPVREIAAFCCGPEEVSLAGFHLRGKFFWIRMDGGAITNTVAVEAREFRFDGRDLLEEQPCAQSAVW